MRIDSVAPDGLAAVRELHGRGVAEYNRGRPWQARKLFDRARLVLDADAGLAASDEGRRLDAALWISHALTEAEVHGAEPGLAALAEARTRAERVGDRGLLVRTHSQAGAIAMRLGRFDAALDAYAAAEAMVEYADRNDHFAVLLNSGYVHLFRGNLAAARFSLVRAAQFAEQADMADERCKALHNLGYLEYLAGDLPTALRLMDDARTADVSVSLGVALIDRARVLMASGLTREADEAFAEAGLVFRRERLWQDVAEVDLSRAECALLAGDVATARRLAARARERFRRRGNAHWRRCADLVLLQGDLAAGRPGTRLVPPALRLRDEFAAERSASQAQTAARIAAEAYLSTGRPEAAADVLADAGRPARHSPIVGRLHDAYVHAALAAAAGKAAAATRIVRSGLAELSAYQASFGSIDLQTASAVHGRRLAELGITLALDGGRPAAVLAAAERARAVSSRLPSIRPPDDPRSAELLAELRQTVEALRPVMGGRDAPAPLLRKRRELERQITARRWTMPGSGDVRAPASLDEVRARLETQDADLVFYVDIAGNLHAVLAGVAGCRLYALGAAEPVREQVRRVRADLDVIAQPRLPEGLRTAVRASLNRSLDALDDALIRPLRAVGRRRLVVVSTGVLGQLPWGALPSLQEVPVVVAPSATAWLAAGEPKPGHGGDVVALAGPDVGRAEHEVTDIGRTWGGASVLTGSSASTEAFTTAMSKGRLVHVAAHGTHQTENPLFSSVRLADGVVFAHELDESVRTPEHVILSACELGLATVRPGDEALGLTSVLLQLGTRSVVAGVARVGDDIAAETMLAYHRHLAAGRDSAAALAQAVPPGEAAPFVCFGASWSDRPKPASAA